MPEQYRPKRNLPPYRLSAAHDQAALVRAVCYCSRPRWYVPADLITLFGDIDCNELERRMPCGKCRSEMRVEIRHPTAAERQRIRVMRLDKVWTVRRASWRREKT